MVDVPSATRNVLISLGAGNDALCMASIDIPRRLVANGGAGKDSSTIDADSVVVGLSQRVHWFEHRQDDMGAAAMTAALDPLMQPEVMQLKLDQAIQTLTKSRQPEELYEQAINEAMEALYPSNLLVLPTPGEPDAQTLFGAHMQNAQKAIDALTEHINKGGSGLGGSRAMAAEARNFIEITREVTEVLSSQTGVTDPNNPGGNPVLNQNDEGGTYVDNILGGLFARGIRSPFFLLPALTGSDDNVTVPGTVAPDEIAIVVKEYQGLRAVLTPRILPIYATPFFSSGPIIAQNKVWTLEFIPAEMIKVYSFANVSDGAGGREIRVDVQTHLSMDRELLHFWRFFH